MLLARLPARSSVRPIGMRERSASEPRRALVRLPAPAPAATGMSTIPTMTAMIRAMTRMSRVTTMTMPRSAAAVSQWGRLARIRGRKTTPLIWDESCLRAALGRVCARAHRLARA